MCMNNTCKPEKKMKMWVKNKPPCLKHQKLKSIQLHMLNEIHTRINIHVWYYTVINTHYGTLQSKEDLINFIWMIWTERMNTWINRCCSSGILVALLAVASVTVAFLLLQSNVSVSQALPVEALWDCSQVGQFLLTKCWVSLMCQTVGGVRWYVPQTWRTQSGLRTPDRRHSWWASVEGSNRVDTLLLRTRRRDHGSAPVWTYSMHCCTCH